MTRLAPHSIEIHEIVEHGKKGSCEKQRRDPKSYTKEVVVRIILINLKRFRDSRLQVLVLNNL